MVGADHGTPSAKREFTDRETPMKLFDAALTKPQSAALDTHDAYRIIVWHGVGGQGKTELRKKVHQRIEKQRADGDSIAVGVLDFEVARHRSPIDAMLKLRLDLGHRRLIAFPTFDLAFAQLFTLERPGDNIRTTYPGLFRKGESEILEDLLGWAGEAAGDVLHLGWTLLPGVEMLYKYSYRLIGGLRDWLDDREVKSRIQDINKLSASELREKLPVYLGFDLWRAMQAPDTPRVVLLIDTYEALWRGTTGQGAMQMLRTDDWVRSLVEQTPGALVVIFGRDKLRWGEIDSAWSKILQQHLLGGLSKEDANLFLYKAGVVSELVRARIVEGAQGLPFYLDLALDQFENLKANGLKPGADDFGSTPVMVLHRFLDHLSASEESELRLASYPEDIDETLFLDLARAFLGGIACVDWARLTRRSFTTQDESGRSSMHAVMRTGLQARERDERAELFREVHLWLFNRYDAQADSAESTSDIGETHDRALLAAAEHLAACDASRLPSWILQQRWKKYYDAGRWRALSIAFDKASCTVEATLTSAPAEAVWFDHHRAHVCQSMGRYEEALELYSRAQKNYKAAFGDHQPEYATILHALGDVLRVTGRESEAETFYADALKIYQAAPGKYDQRYADVLFSLALIDDVNGREVEARAYYRKAQEIYKTSIGGRDPDYANFLLKLGRAHKSNGRTDEAVALYREALDIYKTTNDNLHEGYAATLLDLSDCLAILGEGNEAETGFEQAASIYADALGPEHPNLGQALHQQAAFWIENNKRREAATAQLERAIVILDTALGDEHNWTRKARQDLHRLQA